MARVRTFIGIEIDDAIRGNAVALQQAMAKNGADVHWVPSENLHITLLFLGEVDDRELVAICRAVAEAAKREPPFRLRVSGVGAFPHSRRPKTLWAGVTDGAAELVRLHGLIEAPLLDLGAYRKEERAYTPHLTFGRVKSEADGYQLAPEVSKRLAWEGGHTTVEEVVIFGSELRREGSVYTVLGRAPLRT